MKAVERQFFFNSFSLMVFIFYFPGLILYYFFSGSYEQYYAVSVVPHYSFIVAFPIFLLFFYLSLRLVYSFPTLKVPYIPSFVSGIFLAALVGLYLIFCIKFFLTQSKSFRHTSRLADAGIMVKMMFMLQPIVFVYMSKVLLYLANGGRLGWRNKILVFFVFLAQVVSVNSALQMFSIVISFVMLVAPDIFRIKLSRMPLQKLLLLGIVAFLSVCMAIVGGVANKLGFGFVLSAEGVEYIYESLGNIVARVSSSLYTLGVLFDQGIINLQRNMDVLSGFYQTITNRIALILGSPGFERELITTVNKMNYNLLFAEDNSRAGASPGPLASLIYFPFFPLGLLLLPLFYAFTVRMLASSIVFERKVSIIAGLSVCYFIIYLFEAPLNMFYLIDPVFFGFACIVGFKFINFEKVLAR